MISGPTETNQFNLKEWIRNPLDSLHKLEFAMNHLMFDELKVDDIDQCLQEIQAIMQHLQQEFQKEGKLYLPWIRILDVIAHTKKSLFEKEGMKEKLETLILNLLTQDKTIKTIDWRIARKILSVPHIFKAEKDSLLLPVISKEDLLNAVQRCYVTFKGCETFEGLSLPDFHGFIT